MNAKSAMTAGLLLFVGVSVVVLAVKGTGRESTAAADRTETQKTGGVVAYYFHGNFRCPTCRNMEAYAREAIHTAFSEELDNGELTWKVVNFESPENAHFAERFGLVAASVVLANVSEDPGRDWKNLDAVWRLVRDKDAFMEYVREQTRTFLDRSGG